MTNGPTQERTGAFTTAYPLMQRDRIHLDLNGRLARVTLNRPERLNAMDLAWVKESGNRSL